jgi:hypothetical protein
VKVSYFDKGDDAHGLVHVVERLEQDVGSGAVHVLQRVCKLLQQLEGRLSEVHPDVAHIANLLKQVTHGHETCLLILALVHIAHTEQRLEVGEGESWGRLART